LARYECGRYMRTRIPERIWRNIPPVALELNICRHGLCSTLVTSPCTILLAPQCDARSGCHPCPRRGAAGDAGTRVEPDPPSCAPNTTLRTSQLLAPSTVSEAAERRRSERERTNRTGQEVSDRHRRCHKLRSVETVRHGSPWRRQFGAAASPGAEGLYHPAGMG
jgi:hypothetical protein